ncbi:acylphosphatase [Pradoshia eiseniae]|uniref:acylphosphatase n=1 Tax=Pradoshia eiseniae TaxID=2064768 RepID=A0A2S7N0Y2_9BACI|nr:acylphosphatase [Pradoshia eiseniae]PQD95673.1 acylphosphatase [Pradoshia eiseniae]
MKQYHLIVSGLVQGVGFRYYTERIALSMQIKGWVRNLPDDTVEIVAQGTESALLAFIKEVKNSPGFSRVDDVKIHEQPPENFTAFKIK